MCRCADISSVAARAAQSQALQAAHAAQAVKQQAYHVQQVQFKQPVYDEFLSASTVDKIVGGDSPTDATWFSNGPDVQEVFESSSSASPESVDADVAVEAGAMVCDSATAWMVESKNWRTDEKMLRDEDIMLPGLFEDMEQDSFFHNLSASLNDYKPMVAYSEPAVQDMQARQVGEGAVSAIVIQEESSSSSPDNSGAQEESAKMSKWKKRDINKHLAGERSRRAKRMGKVHTLQAMLPGLSNKPTVNQILAAAIEAIKGTKAGKALPSTAPKADSPFVKFAEVMRSSPFLPSMVLDENSIVMEASTAMLDLLNWPGDEHSIKGQYLSSLLYPDDAVAIIVESSNFRASGLSDNNVKALSTTASFSSFTTVGPQAGFVFPQGYTESMMVDVSVCKNTAFLQVR